MNESKNKIHLNSKNGGITFALFIAGYILVALLGQLIVGAIFGNGSTAYKVICSTFSSVCVLTVVLFYIFYGKHNFTFLTSTKKFNYLYALLAILLSCGMFLGLGFVNESIAEIIFSLGGSVGGINLNMPTVWHFLSFTLTFALLPAIFEEILFRGILLNCFTGMKRIFAVLISALLFALYHQSLVQFVYQFIYGVALAYLAISAKSIIPCMIAHFLNNFAVILFNFIGVYIDLYSVLYIVLGANALAFFGAIVFFIQRKAQKNQSIKGEVKSFFLPFGAMAILICIALTVANLVV